MTRVRRLQLLRLYPLDAEQMLRDAGISRDSEPTQHYLVAIIKLSTGNDT